MTRHTTMRLGHVLQVWAVLLIALMLSPSSHAKMLSITDAPYSAIGDGVTDNGPALARALTAAQRGDVILFPPGNYWVVLTGGALRVPDGVALWGQSGQSRLALATSGAAADYREFLRPGSDVTIEGLTVERAADFPIVLFPVTGDIANITFRNCQIIGNRQRFSNAYCHAFRVGSGVVKNLTLDGLLVRECSFGLFQPNNATGTTDGIAVTNCRFERNTASDLEFNSPNGVMRNVVVRQCYFSDNQSTIPGAGFAVGFANVASGRVEACVIRNYGSEALHVEDRSTDITLADNTIVAASTRQAHGVIVVLNDSRNVKIERNVIDARPNENNPHLILVTAGGTQAKNPSNVTLIGNVLIHSPTTRTWYLQPGSGPPPSDNLIVATPEPTGR